MSEKTKLLVKLFPIIASVLIFALVAFLLYMLMEWVGEQEPAKKQVIQQITVLPPPPPPPPPEVEEEPPPEVEEVEIEEPEEAPEDIPDMAPDEAPPGDQLGLDADGTGAGDAFGLVGRKGGRGLLSGSDPYAWYSTQVQQRIFEALNENHSIRKASYSIVVHIWINDSGLLEKIKLVKGSGKNNLDKKIREAIENISDLGEPSPGMPMPIKVKLTARL